MTSHDPARGDPDGEAPVPATRRKLYQEALGRVPGLRQVAFVVPQVQLEHVAAALIEWPDARATIFVPATAERCSIAAPNARVYRTQNIARMHGVLAAKGPFDVLVEEPGEGQPGRFFSRLLFHVRAGGLYVVGHADAGEDPDQTGDPVGGIVDALATLYRVNVSGGKVGEQVTADARALASSVGSVDFDPARTAFVRSGDSQVKVRHTELDFVIRHQPDRSWMRVISTTPEREVDASTTIGVHNNEPMRERLYPPTLRVPPLSVREYDDVVAHPYGILRKGQLILPDTFRLWLSGRQRNGRLRDLSHYFAQIPGSTDDLPPLTGQYYYLDLEHRFHFGHYLSEALGRLWAWPTAKAANPDLKLLVGGLPHWQRELLQAAGVPLEDIVVLASPASVESVISAMPGYVIGRYVSPEVRDTYRRIQQGMKQVTGPGDELVFLTREPGLWRECLNAAELEAYFVDRGFALHRPEQYSLPEQAALFRDARVVAGYIGSQLYGQILSPDPLQIVGFVNSSYGSKNEFFMATALGHTLHQFWGVDRPGRHADIQGRPLGVGNQDYVFDFEADGDALSALLGRLTGAE